MPLQVFASTPGEGAAGVYWMFYSGSNFEEAALPEALPGVQGQSSAEGLRYKAPISHTCPAHSIGHIPFSREQAGILDEQQPLD